MTRRGVPTSKLLCDEGDPRCDLGSPADDGLCAFSLRLCLNQADARLPECVPAGIEAIEIRRPSPQSSEPGDLANLAALEQAAAAFGVAIYRGGQPYAGGSVNSTPNLCGEPVRLEVPLRQLAGGRSAPGRRLFQLMAYTSSGQIDIDRLALACRPTRCGNGRLDRREECDDGNRIDGDGCDRGCRRE